MFQSDPRDQCDGDGKVEEAFVGDGEDDEHWTESQEDDDEAV